MQIVLVLVAAICTASATIADEPILRAANSGMAVILFSLFLAYRT